MSQSLHCPRCNRRVKAPDQVAGKRVLCPHCEHVFLVPGGSDSAPNEDDDWLSLDDVPPTPAGPPAGDEPDDWFADELPTASTPFPARQAAPVPDREAVGFPDNDFAAPRSGGGRQDPSPPSDPDRQSELDDLGLFDLPKKGPGDEFESEYRVKCPVCGSTTYVNATQAGDTIKCRDCYSPVVVPPPPRKPKKPEMFLDESEHYRFEERPEAKRPDDPFRRSAEELLREAAQSEDEESEPDYDIPRVGEWAASVFGIFMQPAVIVYFLCLATVGSVAAFVALKSEMPVLILGLFPLSLLYSAIVVACGFAILESVSNNEPTVSEWPVLLEPTEWLGSLVVGLSAAGLVGIPAWAFGSFIFGPGLAAVFITMFAIYLLFPFVLLSMLDMQSVFIPFSPEVSRSVTRCQESWGAVYFSSAVLFGGLYLTYVAASLFEPAQAAVIQIFATVAVTFLYFAMLGRLAYRIGQEINEPPGEYEVERKKVRYVDPGEQTSES